MIIPKFHRGEYRTNTYIAADWTGYKNAIEQLHKGD